MTIKEHYTSTVQQAQEATTNIMESFTQTMAKAFSQPTGFPTALPTVDPAEMIDQVFDFWAKTIEVQRDAAKHLLGATASVRDTFKTQAESFGSTVLQQSELATDAVRTQAAHASKEDATK